MLIERNTFVDERKEREEREVMETLKRGDTYYGYRTVPLPIAKEICQDFVEAGYHAKINYFCDSRASYQCFVISKMVLDCSNGRMIYTDIIG